jgi:hypothetical protein
MLARQALYCSIHDSRPDFAFLKVLLCVLVVLGFELRASYMQSKDLKSRHSTA